MRTLDLALIGNGRIGALVAADATIALSGFPRVDVDPVFCKRNVHQFTTQETRDMFFKRSPIL